MKKKTIMFAALVVAVPFISLAAINDATSLFDQVSNWLGTIGQLIIAATVVAIFWGLFMFIFNEDKKDEGKRMMTWGILALFIMVSLWGIIGFLQKSTIGTQTGASEFKTQINNLVPSITTKKK